MIAQKFRKKPIVVEAMQWTGGAEAASPVIQWVLDTGGTARYHDAELPRGWSGAWRVTDYIAIDTLEGTMRANPNDFVIRGVQGEHYPVKPDIFAATYEAVES